MKRLAKNQKKKRKFLTPIVYVVFSATILLTSANIIKKDIKVGNFSNQSKPAIVTEETDKESQNNRIYIDSYIDYYKNYDVKYLYSEYDMSDNSINILLGDVENTTECDYKFNGNIESVIENIKYNSSIYLSKHPEYISYFDFNGSYDILYTILNDIYKNGTNNINEDFHKFNNISLVIDQNLDESVLARYEDNNNLILLACEKIHNANGTNYILSNSTKHVLYHEFNHVRQNTCPCRREKGEKYTDLDYSEYVSFVTESSAESSLLNQKYDDLLYNSDEMYPEERVLECYLFLLGMFNNDNLNNYYNASFDSNWNKLFSFCNVKTEEDKKNLIKIIDNINTPLFRSEKFYNIVINSDTLFAKDMNFTLSYDDMIKANGYNYKIDIYRLFLKNLLEYQNQNNLSLNDNLTLLCYGSNCILSNSKIDMEYRDDFVRMMNDLSNKYIEYIIKSYNVDYNTIYDILNSERFIENLKLLYNTEGTFYESDAYKLRCRFPIIDNISQMLYLNFDYNDMVSKKIKTLS